MSHSVAPSPASSARCEAFVPPPAALWLARLAALVAAAICGYLLWATLAGGAKVAGCGDESAGCGSVLSSGWSHWFVLPVGLPAVFVYLLLGGALAAIGPAATDSTRRGAWRALFVLATLAAGAACWFMALQVFVVGSFCPYCQVVHGCGLSLAAFVFWFGLVGNWPATGAERMRPLAAPQAGLSIACGLLGLGVLVTGQLLSNPPGPAVEIVTLPAHSEKDGTAGMSGAGASSSSASSTGGATSRQRRLSVLQGQTSVNAYDVPLLGAPDADAVVIELFDYTCPTCRELHPWMKQARARYGPQLAVAVLPMPLNPSCNKFVKKQHPGHENACELARLGWAVWRVDPSAFATYHDWAMDSKDAPSPAAARNKAAQLVGEAPLAAALADPEVARRIDEAGRMYDLAGTGAIPKLFCDRTIVSGRTKDAQQLFDLLERTLGLQALTQSPAVP